MRFFTRIVRHPSQQVDLFATSLVMAINTGHGRPFHSSLSSLFLSKKITDVKFPAEFSNLLPYFDDNLFVSTAFQYLCDHFCFDSIAFATSGSDLIRGIDLRNPGLMPPSFKFSFQKSAEYFQSQACSKNSFAHGKDVGVVVKTAQSGRIEVAAQRSADAFVSVGHHGHADP
jgi:hypothetical protein